MRAFARTAAVLLLVGAATGGGPTEGHPHFDDGGTLRWHTKLADAQVAAKKDSKLVLIEYGREA